MIGAEKRFGTLDGQGLNRVDELLPLVVPPARITLGVLIGEHRARCLQHGARDVVFRGDETHLVCLALLFGVNQLRQLRIDLPQIGVMGRSAGQLALHGKIIRDGTRSNCGT